MSSLNKSSSIGNKSSNQNKSGGTINESQIEKIVDKIFNVQNECHFAKDTSNSGDYKTVVCSPTNVVHKMKEYIELKGKKAGNNPVHVVNTMKDLLNCNSESCILKRPDFVEFAKIANLEDLLNEFFKPQGPAVGLAWLSNFNLDDVLDQFETRFSNRKFLHIPFQMRDFEKVGTQLATIDLADKLKSEYKTFGVVLNTDYSNGKGIHWFCLFGENYGNKIVLEYFNSSGKEPLAEVQAWLQKTKHYLAKELKIPVEIHYSTGIVFQNDDASCGVYCLAYIWLRLEQISPKWFNTENFNDTMMHKVRKNLFRHEE